jgi:hypothetical protein
MKTVKKNSKVLSIWLFGLFVTAKGHLNAAGLRKIRNSVYSWLFWDFSDFFLLFEPVSFYIAKTVTNVTICDDFVTR